MPTLEWNRESWNDAYHWPDAGEEWSAMWGGSEAQWFFVIYPRLHLFLPVETLLEIAWGRGRWTHYLRYYCNRLIGVDLSANCVQACTRRFANDSNTSFHVNDGLTLPMVADGSADFVFSFDSLVHAEWDVLESYLNELAVKLARDGIAFLHHSNLAAFTENGAEYEPGSASNPHWRAVSVSAQKVRAYCQRVGLNCVSQELVDWGIDCLSDSFTVLTRDGSRWARPIRIVENCNFMTEARRVASVSAPYVRARSSTTDE